MAVDPPAVLAAPRRRVRCSPRRAHAPSRSRDGGRNACCEIFQLLHAGMADGIPEKHSPAFRMNLLKRAAVHRALISDR